MFIVFRKQSLGFMTLSQGLIALISSHAMCHGELGSGLHYYTLLCVVSIGQLSNIFVQYSEVFNQNSFLLFVCEGFFFPSLSSKLVFLVLLQEVLHKNEIVEPFTSTVDGFVIMARRLMDLLVRLLIPGDSSM